MDDETSASGWLRAILRLQAEIARSSLAMLFGSSGPPEAPTPSVAAERYGAQARSYDLLTAAGEPYRLETVARLDPTPGEVIVEVGCGTGLNFPPIERASDDGARCWASTCAPRCSPRRACGPTGKDGAT